MGFPLTLTLCVTNIFWKEICLKIWMLLPKKDRLIVLTCTKRALDLVVAETRSISDFLYGTFAPWIIRKLTYLISWRSIFWRYIWAFLFVKKTLYFKLKEEEKFRIEFLGWEINIKSSKEIEGVRYSAIILMLFWVYFKLGC